MASLFNPQLPAPPPPPAPPNRNDPSTAKATDEAAQRERKARGRASTILNGPTGLTEQPTLSRQTLLGA